MNYCEMDKILAANIYSSDHGLERLIEAAQKLLNSRRGFERASVRLNNMERHLR
jgi:hypothetical protein